MKHVKMIVAMGLVVLVTGCAMGRSPVTGFLFTEVKGSESVSSNAIGSKTGSSCATSILGWVATGDASSTAAAKAGGITQISSVDYHTRSILGLWAESCTLVTGK